MGTWKRTSTDSATENKGFPLLPKGKYRFLVAESKSEVWKKSGEVYWNLRLEVIEPADVAGRVFHRLSFPADVIPTASAAEQAKQQRWRDEAVFDMEALGLPEEINPENDAQIAVGKTCTATVSHRSYKGQSGDTIITEDIRSLHPDLGPGTVDKGATVSRKDAEGEIPF